MAEGDRGRIFVSPDLVAVLDPGLEGMEPDPALDLAQNLTRYQRVAWRLHAIERWPGPEVARRVARELLASDAQAHVLELLRQAEHLRTLDPVECRRLAEQAVEGAETLGNPGLRARAWAEKGNAERALEDFFEARTSFDRALRLLDSDGGGVLSVRGDVFSLLASLEQDLGHPGKALVCLEKARRCFRSLRWAQGRRRLWKIQIKRANVLFHQGELEAALAEAQGALHSIVRSCGDEEEKDEMALPASHAVLLTLVEIALTAESEDDRRLAVEVAEQGLAELVSSDTSSSILQRPKWKVRHLWLVGRLLAAKGQLHEAEKVLDRCVAEALDRGFPATAAVASLDLALVLARRGELGELRAVARAACVVLEAAGLAPDTWGAQSLLLDCDLTTAESVIVEGLQRAGGASLRRTRERS